MTSVLGRPFRLALLLASTLGVAAAGGADNDPKQYPHSMAEIKAMTQLLGAKKGAGASLQNVFLSRLRQHRYIAGVPFEIGWDTKGQELAEKASYICAKLNQMTHTPSKPAGMSDAEYQICSTGAGQSNLYTGLTEPVACIDGWMDDSDEKNIDRVGHRRWCLNPPLSKSAFGTVGNYSAMWVYDMSGPPMSQDYDMIGYPARGYMPIQFFGPKIAWSCTPNLSKFEGFDEAQIKVTVNLADAKLNPVGQPLKLDFFKVSSTPVGGGPAIIFRPANFNLNEAAYVVDIAGLKPRSGEASFRYVVHFFNLGKVPEGPETAAVYSKYFQGRVAAVQELPEKLDQLEGLTDLFENEYLRDPAVKGPVQKSIVELLKDPAVKKEHEGMIRYRQLNAMESKAGKSKAQMAQVASGYRDLAAAFKDTRAGTKAAADFERLKALVQ